METLDDIEQYWQTVGQDVTVMLDGRDTIRASADGGRVSGLRELLLVWAAESGHDQTGAPDLVVHEQLGKGGMGEVRRAMQGSLAREVAIKLAHGGTDSVHARALLKEARLTAGLAHPNVVPVHALGLAEDGTPVLVMKRIRGYCWADLLADSAHPGWVAWDQRAGGRLQANLEVLSQVCDALAFAHSKGLVHRDIKPDNVMLGDFGEVYLVDWGIALSVDDPAEERLVGTPAYFAPEMAMGNPVSPLTDVYLVGATLYEVLTGEPPHAGRCLMDFVASALAPKTAAAFPHAVSLDLIELCQGTMAPDPSDRPQSTTEVRQAIVRHERRAESDRLSEEGEARVEEVRAQLQSEELDLADGSRLCAEAQFAFEQALKVWPSNPRAAAGVREVARTRVGLHLGRRDLEAARAAALVLDDNEPSQALREQIELLAKELTEQERERENFRRIADAHDETIGAGVRRNGFIAIPAVTILVVGVFLGGRTVGIDTFQHAWFAGASGVFLAVGLLFSAAYRKELEHPFNRRGVQLTLVFLGAMLGNRLLCWANGSSIPLMLSTDALFLAVAAMTTGIFLMRWVVWASLILGATSVVTAFLPRESATLVFALGVVMASLVAVWGWGRHQR